MPEQVQLNLKDNKEESHSASIYSENDYPKESLTEPILRRKQLFEQADVYYYKREMKVKNKKKRDLTDMLDYKLDLTKTLMKKYKRCSIKNLSSSNQMKTERKSLKKYKKMLKNMINSLEDIDDRTVKVVRHCHNFYEILPRD